VSELPRLVTTTPTLHTVPGLLVFLLDVFLQDSALCPDLGSQDFCYQLSAASGERRLSVLLPKPNGTNFKSQRWTDRRGAWKKLFTIIRTQAQGVAASSVVTLGLHSMWCTSLPTLQYPLHSYWCFATLIDCFFP
jgi:hypothetical protein